MPPTSGAIDQVTVEFAAFETTAANCCVCPWPNVTAGGVTETDNGGDTVIATDADFEASSTLVAVTVTFTAEAIAAGAVKSPAAEIVPVAGFKLQVTAEFTAFVRAAENCSVWPGCTVRLAGETETEMGGRKVTGALADLETSSTLVAVTVAVCTVLIDAGVV